MFKLLENEKVILLRRRHWFTILIEGLSLFLMACLPFAGILILNTVYPNIKDFLSDYWVFIAFYGAVWLQLLWMGFFVIWTNYYLDVFIVTNKRIIDIEQFSLFARDFAELRLENLQDIKVEMIGLINSLLKIGDLHVQTAGQAKEIFFRNIPDPQGVKHIISQCYDDLLKERQFPSSSLSR